MERPRIFGFTVFCAYNNGQDLESKDGSRYCHRESAGSAILARKPLGSIKGLLQRDVDMDVEVDSDVDSYFGSLKRVSKSVQVLFNGIEAVMVLTLMIVVN